MKHLVRSLCVALAGAPAFAGSDLPRMRPDGEFPEWTQLSPIATDPQGDASAAFDVTTVYAASRGSVLFIRFDIGAVLNLVEGDPIDGTLRLELNGLPNGQRLTIDYRARIGYLNGDTTQVIPWPTLNYAVLPTFASTEHETTLDLAALGVSQGDTITLDFSGSDSLAAPAPFTLQDPSPAPVRRSADRSAGALRVISQNTHNTGFLDTSENARFNRLLDAVRPDVICLQEEYNSSAAQIQARLAVINPHGDGAQWNVHKVGDNVVAARESLTPIPVHASGYAAAIVHHAEGPILVLSIHPRCCGYTGSEQDNDRITQTLGMVQTIQEVRAGQHGPFADAPVIVIGDWNLVGSRTPLDMLTDPSGPALRWILPNSLIGESVTTWRSANVTFAPGVLDLVVYDDNALSHRNHFVLDTAALNATELAALGLQAGDSDASDHLMLVVDFVFAPACPLDLDYDNAVGFTDLNVLLASFNCRGADIRGDIDDDGDVDFADINALISQFNTICPTNP